MKPVQVGWQSHIDIIGCQCDNCVGKRRAKSTVVPDAASNKLMPLATGVLDYFPDALLAVSIVSRIGSEQHNPGQPVHWDKAKSQDEADALLRHFLKRGTFDSDGARHSAKVAWRALALLQRELEAETKQPKG